MNIHFFIHESFESPGAIETWANAHHHPVSYTRFYQNDALPETVDGFDYLIVMGGPQSPATTERECPHFHAKDEIACIKTAIDKNKFVLGVCLGAQLIGEALGAAFDHSPNREIGVFDVTLTDKAQEDFIFFPFSPHLSRRSLARGHAGTYPNSGNTCSKRGLPEADRTVHTEGVRVPVSF